jgi:cytochrome c5
MLLSTIASSWLVLATAPLYAADGEAVYNKSCKMCHVTNMMGAPKTGDAQAWKPLIAKGRDVLYDHAINGFSDKGKMPPRGGDSSLTDDEVKAAVDYMLGQVE